MNQQAPTPLARLAAGVLLVTGLLAGATAHAAPPPVGVIIKFDKSSQTRSASKGTALPDELRAQRMGDDAVRALGLGGAMSLRHQRRLGMGADLFAVDAATPLDLARVLASLRTAPGVAYAVEDKRLEPNFVPNDPLYAQQWHYFESVGGIRLPAAWDVATGEGVVVAVVDTGYTDHNDLVANVIPGYDFIADGAAARDGNKRDADAHDEGDFEIDPEVGQLYPSSWHGTHVAGTIAAVTNNGRGVAGVAFDAKILPIRVLGIYGGTISDIYDGLIWAAGGAVGRLPANPTPAKIVNMSLGGPGACAEPEQDAIDTARSLGATIVVSAGNDNYDADAQSPSSCKGVIVVAATDRVGERAVYSNTGISVDIAAPGGETITTLGYGVLSTLDKGDKLPKGSGYDYYQGTSMAAPHVAGVAALMASVDPSLTAGEIACTLQATARPFPHPEACPNCGAGIVNAAAAVRAVRDGDIARSCGTPRVSTPIEFGQVPDISGERGDQVRFVVVDVAPNQLITVKTSGGLGDADLLVSLGKAPTLGAADCGSFSIGNGERCVIATPESGRSKLKILVHGYQEFRDLTLSVRAQDILPLPMGLTEGLSGAKNSRRIYRYRSPPEGGVLRLNTFGGSGDVDLYVLVRDANDNLLSACSSVELGNDESCRVDLEPGGATYDIELIAYRAYEGLSLRARYTPPQFLEHDVEEVISGAAGSVKTFRVEVPEGSTKLRVALIPGTGDADLHVKVLDPNDPVYVCHSTTTSTEVCAIPDPRPGFYDVQVTGYTDYANFRLRANLTPAP
ncbi:MAG TPA: S8 family peptidase [Nevskiaceae bacterium]|nr:S8 family peptidase [Nevskiaceae bacterium]